MGAVRNHVARFFPRKFGSKLYLRREPICVEAEGAHTAPFECSRNAVDREVIPTVCQQQNDVASWCQSHVNAD
jgi:hypothetical protein